MARSTPTAREQARKLQLQQERKQKMQSLWLRIGVVVVAVALVAGLTFWVVTRDSNGGNYTEGPAPSAATEAGGVVMTGPNEVAEGDDLGTVDAEQTPTLDGGPGTAREEGEPPHMVVYLDPHCPHCAQFESTYQSFFDALLDEGLITLEYRSLDYLSSRSNYSARAGNAFACMAEESPENYSDYLGDITANYQGDELDNESLASIAADQYGADIGSCIEDNTYRAFVAYTSNTASNNGVQGTPTLYVNDTEYAGSEFVTPLIEEARAYADEADMESEILDQLEQQVSGEGEDGQSQQDQDGEDSGDGNEQSEDDGEQ